MGIESIAKGLASLQEIDIVEIDTAIDWLQEALAAYKTLRAIREVMERKPKSLKLPEWKSAVDIDKEEITHADGSMYGGAVKTRLIKALEGSDVPLTMDELVHMTGLDRKRVKSGLTNHRGKVFGRYENGSWYLIDKKAPNKPIAIKMPDYDDTPMSHFMDCKVDEDGYKVR
jgi:hypothetical protein